MANCWSCALKRVGDCCYRQLSSWLDVCMLLSDNVLLKSSNMNPMGMTWKWCEHCPFENMNGAVQKAWFQKLVKELLDAVQHLFVKLKEIEGKEVLPTSQLQSEYVDEQNCLFLKQAKQLYHWLHSNKNFHKRYWKSRVKLVPVILIQQS